MNKRLIRLVILGCPKNRADAEAVAGYFQLAGFDVTLAEVKADAAVALTCAFVRDAEEEAIEHIMALVEERRQGRIGALVVSGCLPQRHRDEDLRKTIPEVDAWVSASDYPRIGNILKQLLNNGRTWHKVSAVAGYLPNRARRVRLGTEPFAYVKVSEGCRNRCAYCTIPSIRGDFRSRALANVIDEAASLVEEGGAKEIVLVGQDTALYGADLYGKPRLADLIRRVAKRIPDAWVRVMYSHPAHLTEDVLDVIAALENVCPYLDIPIQHVATSTLRRMGRPGSRRELEKLVSRIREKIPGVVIRTTVMVGFPGETEKEFGQLMSFIGKARLERLGAFPYSREEGTKAYNMKSQVRARVKQRRLDEVMKLQQEISWDIQQDWVGREVMVLVDGPDPDRPGWSVARSMCHAPEVDAGINIEKILEPGERLKVKIVDALPYDLEAVIVEH